MNRNQTHLNDNDTVSAPIAAVFDNWQAANNALMELERAGFDSDRIGIARLDGERQDVVVDKTYKDGGKSVAKGVGTGAVLGGATGLAAALASLLIPGVGPIVAGGVLATTFGAAAGTAIAGAGIGAGVGAAAGGLIGSLSSLGFSDEEARYYESEIRAGRTLLTVSPGFNDAEARRILSANGGRLWAA